jgi:hypothetical protein
MPINQTMAYNANSIPTNTKITPALTLQKHLDLTTTKQPTNFNTSETTPKHLILKNCLPTTKDTINLNTDRLPHTQYVSDSKPTNTEAIKLPLELESLKQIISSQPKVLTPYLIELGNITLTHSKQIERKRDSFTLLANNKKIPRSLRIKCELSTSHLYIKDPIYIQLKEELQNAVSDFIMKGTKIMTEWAKHNIELLILDRCLSFFNKALQIFDGLVSYNTETSLVPKWSLPSPRHLNLFLLKLYLSNSYIDISDILNFFEITPDTILLICSKLLFHSDNEDEVINILNSLELTEINLNEKFNTIL